MSLLELNWIMERGYWISLDFCCKKKGKNEWSVKQKRKWSKVVSQLCEMNLFSERKSCVKNLKHAIYEYAIEDEVMQILEEMERMTQFWLYVISKTPKPLPKLQKSKVQNLFEFAWFHFIITCICDAISGLV
jgi:hypothetical protein